MLQHELESDEDFIFRKLRNIRYVICNNKIMRIGDLKKGDIFVFMDQEDSWIADGDPQTNDDGLYEIEAYKLGSTKC
jgi:hypothetical protein